VALQRRPSNKETKPRRLETPPLEPKTGMKKRNKEILESKSKEKEAVSRDTSEAHAEALLVQINNGGYFSLDSPSSSSGSPPDWTHLDRDQRNPHAELTLPRVREGGHGHSKMWKCFKQMGLYSWHQRGS